MIIHGSINHTYSGRRKKKLKTQKKKKAEFVPLKREKHSCSPAWWEVKKKEQRSAPFIPFEPKQIEDTSYRQEVSKKYTVSVPYNKGAYQVISKEDVKHIGK